MDEFLKDYTFTKRNNAEVMLVQRHGAKVSLKVGNTYVCRVNAVDYGVLLVNLEFKEKAFFSINVDLFVRETLFQPDVYFYNLATISERGTRFPLQVDTITNNIEFWKTLTPQEFQHQHTEVQFLRATSKSGKQCRLEMAKMRDREEGALLDEIKNKTLLPTVRVVREGEVVVGYAIRKNYPLQKLWELRRLDEVYHKNDQTTTIQKQRVTRLDDDALVAVDEVGVERAYPYAEYDLPFWNFTQKKGGGTRRRRRRHHFRVARRTSSGVKRSNVSV